MKIKQYVIDAFADEVFHGNPAAVCPLEAWLDDTILQAIAAENNLSETAFYVPNGTGFELRWFTPTAEVDLCGHATLASAHVLFAHRNYQQANIRFATRSGELVVQRRGDFYDMIFPASIPHESKLPAKLQAGLGGPIEACYAAEDYLVVYPSEQDITAIEPDLELLKQLSLRGVIVTAPGTACDFVSRFFAPLLGIAEDPVTGSAHCQLAPYWAQRLGKNELTAMQLSKRRGALSCRLDNDKVTLSGQAVTFLQGEIDIPLR